MRFAAYVTIAGLSLYATACSQKPHPDSGAARTVSMATTAPADAPIAFAMSAQVPNDPRLEPLRFLREYGARMRPSLEFGATNEWEWRIWHTMLRRQLTAAIGMPAHSPFPLRVTEGPVVHCDGFTRRALTIETAPGLFAPAFLLIPDGLTGPRPAILCAHGHGAGMNDLVGLTETGEPRAFGEGYQHDFAIQAVKAGFVALAYDQMGFGRRRDVEFNKKNNLWNACEQPSKNALHYGLSMTGIRVHDAMRMIEFLQSRPEVKRDRIGMAGISGGGLVTQFTAALDDRVKAACVSGFCCRYAACILNMHHCIDNYVPGIGEIADDDDVACLIAPRPLLIEAGTKDPIFPIEATREAIAKVTRCYTLLGVRDRLDTDVFEGTHQFSGAKTWKFFVQHLGDPTKTK